MEKVALLYDGDCGFCRWSVGKVLAWDRNDRLRPVALRNPEAERLLPPMDASSMMSSWHLVTTDGRTYSGGAVADPLLRLLPGGKPLAAICRTFPSATERIYRLVARNRGRFGRWF